MKFIVKTLACIGLALIAMAGLTQTAWATQKLPSTYDDHRDSAIYNGHQNMPFTNLGIGIKWELACRQGNTAMCVKMAQAFEDGLGDLQADPRVALGFYKMACDQGDGASCARAARIALDGSANFSDADVARDFATRGCNALKNQDACAALAQASAASGDTETATTLAATACDAGSDEGCRLKAQSLFYDSHDAAALPLLETACTARHAWGCAGLSDAYENGWGGVVKDHDRSAAYATTGCEQSSGAGRWDACRQHGIFLTWSDDKATINKGEQYLDADCRYGDARACQWLGLLGLRAKAGATTTLIEGLYYERRACDLGNADGCDELGLAYETGNGISTDDPNAIAVPLYDKACKLGRAQSCARADRIMAEDPTTRERRPSVDPSDTVAQQLVTAQDLVNRNLDASGAVLSVYRLTQEDNEDAEWLLGGWMYYGLPGVFDEPRIEDGFTLFENAARVGHVEAAIWVGMAYWYGDGVDEDRPKGENYMAIAAARGSQEAADILRSMQLEPEREEMARQAAAAEEAARYQKSAWDQAMDAWNVAIANYANSSSSYNYSSTSTYTSVPDVTDKLNFNYAMDYYSGATTACLSSNPYCN